MTDSSREGRPIMVAVFATTIWTWRTEKPASASSKQRIRPWILETTPGVGWLYDEVHVRTEPIRRPGVNCSINLECVQAPPRTDQPS